MVRQRSLRNYPPGPDWGFFMPTPRSLVVRAWAGYFAGNQIGGHARIQATGPCLLAPAYARAGAAPAYRPKGGVCLGLRPVQRPRGAAVHIV